MINDGASENTIKAIKKVRKEVKKRVLPIKKIKKSPTVSQKSPKSLPISHKSPRSLLPSQTIPLPKESPKSVPKKAPKPLPLPSQSNLSQFSIRNQSIPHQQLSQPPQRLPPQYLNQSIPQQTISSSNIVYLNKELDKKSKEKEVLLNKIKKINNKKRDIRLKNKDFLFSNKDNTLNDSLISKILRIVLNRYIIGNCETTKEFLFTYCKLLLLNKSIYNNLYVANFNIKELFRFTCEITTQFKGNTSLIRYVLYKSNPNRKKKYDLLLDKVFDKIKTTKIYTVVTDVDNRNFEEFFIENLHERFSSDFIIKFLLIMTFFTSTIVINKFEKVDSKKSYNCLLIKRNISKTQFYIPLLKNDGTIEPVIEGDELVSTPWSRLSIRNINENIGLSNKILNARPYFEDLLKKLHDILFPPMNVKK